LHAWGIASGLHRCILAHRYDIRLAAIIFSRPLAFFVDRFPLLPPDLLVAAIAIENLRHLAFCAITGCAVAQPKNTAAAAARRDQPVFCSRCVIEPTSVIECPGGPARAGADV
jgi:hypothetical protein